MYFQADIYNWILKKNWNGFNSLDKIIKAYKPLFEKKYYHPCEIKNFQDLDVELRKAKRFYSAKIKVEINTDEGIKKFKLIDISETGLSIMILKGFSFNGIVTSGLIHLRNWRKVTTYLFTVF